MKLRWLVVALFGMSIAPGAHAGAKLYSGTLYVRAWGNDVVQTVTAMGMAEYRSSYTQVLWTGHPLTHFCNYHEFTMTVSMGVVMTGTMYISTAYPRPRESLAMYCDVEEVKRWYTVKGGGR